MAWVLSVHVSKEYSRFDPAFEDALRMRPDESSAGVRRRCNFSFLTCFSGEKDGTAVRPEREGAKPNDSRIAPQGRLNQCGTPTTTPNAASASVIQRDHGAITTAAITHEDANLRHSLPEFLPEAIAHLSTRPEDATWFRFKARLNLLKGFKSTPLPDTSFLSPGRDT